MGKQVVAGFSPRSARMTDVMELSPEIRRYYEDAPEAERLQTGSFQLELKFLSFMCRLRLWSDSALLRRVETGVD